MLFPASLARYPGPRQTRPEALESLDDVLGDLAAEELEPEPEPEPAPEREAEAEGAGAEAEGAGSGLLGRYFGGMLKEPLVDKSPRTEGKNRLDPNLRLGAQATVVLGLLFLGFMAANGLL